MVAVVAPAVPPRITPDGAKPVTGLVNVTANCTEGVWVGFACPGASATPTPGRTLSNATGGAAAGVFGFPARSVTAAAGGAVTTAPRPGLPPVLPLVCPGP